MSIDIDKCALLKVKLVPQNVSINGTEITYLHRSTGRVRITSSAYQKLRNSDRKEYVLAGICRRKHEFDQPPILIDSELLSRGLDNLPSPQSFEEKVHDFLVYLYDKGGSVNKKFDFDSSVDHPLTYSDEEEFIRVIDWLENEYLIEIGDKNDSDKNGGLFCINVKLTSLGRDKVKETKPKMPLFGLVSQEIETGDIKTDEKINHARKLFFREYATLDEKRSACETLSYILEPIRKNLSSHFVKKDVEDFFNIVNNFDIRHNKDHTKKLIYEEQLEWVFFSLLNTINTYVKVEKRLGNKNSS